MKSTPEPVPSFARSVTDTGETLFHPVALAAGVVLAVRDGAVVSTTMAWLACEPAPPTAKIVCAPSEVDGSVIDGEAPPELFALEGEPLRVVPVEASSS